MRKSSAEGPDELLAQMMKLTNVVALSAVRGLEKQEQVVLLAGAGYAPTEIATMLSMNATTVRTTIHRMKKKAESA
jgi:DNA-directed RNA polymerase specialized sigma24 family protein